MKTLLALALVLLSTSALAQYNINYLPTPTGPATGALAGNYPNPTLASGGIANSFLSNVGAHNTKINPTGSAGVVQDLQVPNCPAGLAYVWGTPDVYQCASALPTPTLFGSGWGTGAAITAWTNGTLFQITVGTSANNNAQLTFVAQPNGILCSGQDETSNLAAVQSAHTTTSSTLKFFTRTGTATAPTAGDVMIITCTGG